MVLHAQVPTSGLVLYYPFSGNSNDGSGNGHNATPVNGPNLTRDRFGQLNRAYTFDGVNDYFRVTNHADFLFDTGSSFTISVWFRTCMPSDDRGKRPCFFGIPKTQGSVSSEDKKGYGLNYFNQDPRSVEAHGETTPAAGTAGSGISYLTNMQLNDGLWHHAVFVLNYTTKTEILYVDNTSYSESFTFAFPPVNRTANPSDAYIGTNPRFIGTVVAEHFHGDIDDIRVYNRALTTTEVNALYTESGWPTSLNRTLNFNFEAVDDTVICKGDSVRLLLSGTYDGVFWNTTEGISDPQVRNPIAKPTQTTTYEVTGYREIYRDPCGDTVILRKSVRVIVLDPPIANAGSAQFLCTGDTLTLGGLTTGGLPPYQWQWTPSIGLDNDKIERPNVVVTQSERYQVIVTDAKGCRDTAFVSVTVVDPPEVEIVGTDTAYYCQGSGVLELVAEGQGGNPPYRYRWSGEGLNRTDSSVVLVEPTKETMYVVEISDGAGICTGLDSVLVIPVDRPEAEAGEGQVLCVGAVVELGDGSGGNAGWEYDWQPRAGLDDGSVANPRASPNLTTVYRLRVSDAKTGCWSEDSVEVRVEDVEVASTESILDYGLLGGCRTDSVALLTLQNSGKSKGTITSWRSEVSGVSVLDVGSEIPELGTTGVRVRFAPSGSGSYSGRLVLYVGPCEDSVVVEVVGSKESSSIGIDVGSVDFGLVRSCDVGEVDTVLVITNSSASPAEIGPGLVRMPYEIVSPSLPATVGAGERLEVRLRYRPVGVGRYVDELRLPYASGACRDTLRVSLRGEVEEVVLASNIESIDFGLLDGCTTSRDTVIEVENGSSFAITLDGARLPSGYVLLESLPLSIPSGSRRSLRLRYSPSSGGVAQGDGVLEYSPCSGALSIGLRGEKRGVRYTMVDTVDFGEIVSCVGIEKGVVIGLLLESEGTGDGSIRSVRVEGSFASDLQGGEVLEDGKEKEFGIRFVPPGEGVYEGALIVELEPCGVERRVELRGRLSRASMRGEGLSFGVVPSGSQRRGEVLFVNDGSSSERVERVRGVVSPFQVVGTTPMLPATLEVGDTLRVEIDYEAEGGPSRSDVVIEVSSPCAVEYMAEVVGEGTMGGYSRIVLPELIGSPGEELRLRVEVSESSGLDAVEGVGFVAEVGFESSVLVGLGGSVGEIEGDERIVEVRGDVSGGEVLVGVTLGRVESTGLRLRSIRWEDGTGGVLPVSVDTVHGSFTLSGLCRTGGVRLYDPRGGVGIKSVSPNPSGGKVRIVYSVVESGAHSMRVVDGMGRQVGLVFSGLFIPGEYELEWMGAGLSSGIYWIVLETPTLVLTEPLQVKN
ncbi:MAG: LamG-like jellyroll fold domain-containing protein [Candidatus Kapaibacterium sp.]